MPGLARHGILDKALPTYPCFISLHSASACCAVLCCAVLCCAVLCCAVLCCAVLCCAVLCCAVLCCSYTDCMLCAETSSRHARWTSDIRLLALDMDGTLLDSNSKVLPSSIKAIKVMSPAVHASTDTNPHLQKIIVLELASPLAASAAASGLALLTIISHFWLVPVLKKMVCECTP